MKQFRFFIFSLVFLGLCLKISVARSQAPTEADVNLNLSEEEQTLATLSNQINEMVGQFQGMKGGIGENQKKNQDQDKAVEDLQTRLQTLEDRISLLMAQLSELRTEGLLKPDAKKNLDEYVDYIKSVEPVNAKNYKKAITSLEQFQGKYPKSVYAQDAQFWIGEAYYLQSDYPMAVKAYQKLIAKAPQSAKASLALYKQGVSFLQMQSFEDAKAFFSKVVRAYPGTMEAVQSNSQIHRIDEILAMRKQEELEKNAIEY